MTARVKHVVTMFPSGRAPQVVVVTAVARAAVVVLAAVASWQAAEVDTTVVVAVMDVMTEAARVGAVMTAVTIAKTRGEMIGVTIGEMIAATTAAMTAVSEIVMTVVLRVASVSAEGREKTSAKAATDM